MSVFVDTSALFAILDADDQNHEQAKQGRATLKRGSIPVLPRFALDYLSQSRLGLAIDPPP
jgi:predicted nucleic acid-binding protein